ncbi:hypothetical protein HQ590_05750 [bacterium]|nr:hypothetical protein [bacterium]
MSTLEEIKQAVSHLTLAERAEFAKWFNGWEDDDWDKEMQADARAGKLDSLLAEVDADIRSGTLTDMPRSDGKP